MEIVRPSVRPSVLPSVLPSQSIQRLAALPVKKRTVKHPLLCEQCTAAELNAMVIARGGNVTRHDGSGGMLIKEELIKVLERQYDNKKETTGSGYQWYFLDHTNWTQEGHWFDVERCCPQARVSPFKTIDYDFFVENRNLHSGN